MYLPYKCHTCSGFVTPWLSSSITSLLTKTPWGWGSRIVAQRFPKAMPSILHPFKKISGNAFLRPKFRCGKLLQKGVGPDTLVAGFILNLAWVTYPNLRVCDDESILTWTIGIAAKLSTATNICLRGTYFLLSRSSEPIFYLDVSKTKGLRRRWERTTGGFGICCFLWWVMILNQQVPPQMSTSLKAFGDPLWISNQECFWNYTHLSFVQVRNEEVPKI